MIDCSCMHLEYHSMRSLNMVASFSSLSQKHLNSLLKSNYGDLLTKLENIIQKGRYFLSE